MYKIMALDIGTKRIGIALSDFLHVLASGHSYIPRKPEEEALEKIANIAKENRVEKIVVGVPVNMDGTQGFQARDCIEFSKKITGFEVVYADERLSSETAEENLRSKKIDFRKEKGLVDMESACVILEQYLAEVQNKK